MKIIFLLRKNINLKWNDMPVLRNLREEVTNYRK